MKSTIQIKKTFKILLERFNADDIFTLWNQSNALYRTLQRKEGDFAHFFKKSSVFVWLMLQQNVVLDYYLGKYSASNLPCEI